MDPKLASVENDAGESPLYLAARGGMFEILNQILKSTASSAHGGSDGQTTLHAAVIEKHFEGHSPIHVAANKGHTSVIREIIRHCPDLGEICDIYGQNALHMAIVGGQANVARYILETPELECLINQPDVNGNTPLHLATMERKTWIVYYLMWDGRVHQSSKNKCGQAAFDIDR
ncbi:hypothetical protein CerSpe_157220 [Prunus speciosa]